MKWLKTVAKCVSNLNAKGLSKNRILGRAGMSLVELMIVVGISSIVVLGAGSVMVFVADSFSKIIDKDEAEGNLTRAAYALRTIATQAVGLYMVGASAAGEGIGVTGEAGGAASTDVYQGQIVATVTTERLTTPIVGGGFDPGVQANRGRIIEIAQFHRETAANNVTQNSFFQPTAIYFKTPWHRCAPNIQDADDAAFASTRDDCSGQLIIVWNSAGVGSNLNGVLTAPAGGANHQLAANPGGNIQTQIFERFISIRVDTTAVNGVGSYARDARFRLTSRYFLGLQARTWNYNPNDIGHMAKELSMEVYVGFRNNYQGRSQLTTNEPERLHGSVYYFPFVSSLQVWL